MRASAFRGGLRLTHHKDATRSRAISEVPLPAELTVPLSQSAGSPAVAEVVKGDRVRAGQRIGDTDAFCSAPVHAPVDGTVTSVELANHHLGIPLMSVRIVPEDPGKVPASPVPVGIGFSSEAAANEVDADDIRRAVRDAGVVGLGGAAFPTHVKLAPPKERPVDTIIINGCECEPYLTCDHRNMLERAPDVLDGARLIAQAVGARRVVFALEAGSPEVERALASALEPGRLSEAHGRHGPPVEVAVLPARYPQGSEKQLIKALLGREVPPGGLPFDVGAYVQNAGTTIAVSEAVRHGRPLVDRAVTVAGAVKDPGNFRVIIGTPVRHLIVDVCGGFEGQPGRVIMGGPMMGVALFNLDVPVVKATSGIVVIAAEEDGRVSGRARAGNCIRCGRCVRACPAGLVPAALGHFARLEMWDEAGRAHVLDCIECGCCAYSCPASIPLVQLFRLAKATIYGQRK